MRLRVQTVLNRLPEYRVLKRRYQSKWSSNLRVHETETEVKE